MSERPSLGQDLSVRFGGVLAVNKVSFDVRRARCSR
jgi:ABC-type branched-subunit amino acid transport system ATPase component